MHKASVASAIGIRSILGGIFANLLLAVVKAVTGILGNSYALVADAIESTLDVFTSFIVWAGLKTASRAPDANHPYGHGKAEPLAAILVTFFLVGAAILIAIQSTEHIMLPHQPPALFTLPVLFVVILVKELLYRWVYKRGVEINSTAVKSDAWHHRSDALTSLAAFTGISIALIGGKGYESADDWAALIAAAIIVFNAYRIFKPAFLEIMDTAPPSEIAEKIRIISLDVNGVEGIDQCLVRKMGLEYFVDIHIIVNGQLTVKEGHSIGHRVKDHIMSNIPSVFDVLTHVEPANGPGSD
jgi:cation diffusion facilitator family transporter